MVEDSEVFKNKHGENNSKYQTSAERLQVLIKGNEAIEGYLRAVGGLSDVSGTYLPKLIESGCMEAYGTLNVKSMTEEDMNNLNLILMQLKSTNDEFEKLKV